MRAIAWAAVACGASLQLQDVRHLPSLSVVLLLPQDDTNIYAPALARYDNRVETMLGMGAAGVVEALLRTACRMPSQPECAAMKAQVHPNARGSDSEGQNASPEGCTG